ncbi:MAG: hypothetical protein M1834_005340 [Cirrosporium novae-zelandiae]|nr:MAG: hypothetical protein M1834_005340 [Cirrosporium novae-zelandiae]
MSAGSHLGQESDSNSEWQDLSNSDAKRVTIKSDSKSKLQQKSRPKRIRKTKIRSGLKLPRRLRDISANVQEEYRKLLNSDIANVATKNVFRNIQPLESSQIGLTLWAREEKEVFFDVLALKGRDDVNAIASAIGTKSEAEVQWYIDILQKGLREYHLKGKRQSLRGFRDFPAATELSEECCDALERAADALEFVQQKREERKGKKQYPDGWVLTKDVTESVKEHLAVNPDEEGRTFPSASLLQLTSWLDLSERIFMNPSPSQGREEENWQTMIPVGKSEHEPPSITRMAFDKFHLLTISITKRIVQTAIFFAMSRLRAMDGSGRYKPKGAVRGGDVRAALKNLNMTLDTRDYWINLARRHHLNVCRIEKKRKAQLDGPPLSYEEVEQQLSIPWKRSQVDLRTATSHKSDGFNIDDPGQLETDSFTFSEDESTTSNSDSDASDEKPSTNSNANDGLEDAEDFLPIDSSLHQQVLAQYTYERNQDIHAEASDKRESYYVEQSLWNILNLTPPSLSDPASLEVPRKPKKLRKTSHELVDWRDKFPLDYIPPEYEMYRGFVPEEEFERNKRRMEKAKRKKEEMKRAVIVEAEAERPGINVSGSKDFPKEEESPGDSSPEYEDDHSSEEDTEADLSTRKPSPELGLPADDPSSDDDEDASIESNEDSDEESEQDIQTMPPMKPDKAPPTDGSDNSSRSSETSNDSSEVSDEGSDEMRESENAGPTPEKQRANRFRTHEAEAYMASSPNGLAEIPGPSQSTHSVEDVQSRQRITTSPILGDESSIGNEQDSSDGDEEGETEKDENETDEDEEDEEEENETKENKKQEKDMEMGTPPPPPPPLPAWYQGDADDFSEYIPSD